MTKLTLNTESLPVIHNEYEQFDKATKSFIGKDIVAPVFERDGQIFCDSECENAALFSDYHGEFHGGYAWVNPILEDWAKKEYGKDAYWEWENAGLLCLAI